ncbi:MAG: hypothetical protein ACYTGN_14085 [Planctomycetota bacterium]|jgi:hypothetical protein
MTVGLIKRLLSLANVLAVLGIAGAAYGFWSHRSTINQRWNAPDFVIAPTTRGIKGSGRIGDTNIALGMFPKVAEDTGPAKEQPKEVEIQKAIDELGAILGAIVVYPPYDKGLQPALIFQYKSPPQGLDKVVTIRLGEALITRPVPDPDNPGWVDRENVQFTFVGCEPDKERPGGTYFLFKVREGDKKVEKARWQGEIEGTSLPEAKADEGDSALKNSGIVRGGRKPRRPAKTGVATQPVPPRPTELRGSIFDKRGGTSEITDRGLTYLRDNHQKLLKEAYTQPYVGKDGKRGVKIRKIGKGAKGVANEFGLLDGDVILAVNGKPVASRTQAVNQVKRQINAKVRFIEVKILRLGAQKVLRFDARDPETRRKAKDALRNR